MSGANREAGYRTYWLTWVLLLLLTLTMVFITQAPLSRALIGGFLVLGMFTKASLIGAYFMHLRFEKMNLVATVVIAILFTAAVLFLLVAPDGLQLLRQRPG